MKNLFILSIIFTLVGFYSCQTRFNDEPSSEDYSSGESEVEISIVTDPVSRMKILSKILMYCFLTQKGNFFVGELLLK